MLENLKSEVIRVARAAEASGLCKHKSGNFSTRDPETGYVVVTPSAIAREKLTVDDICVLDVDLNIIEQKTDAKPSSEAIMHLEIYKVRPDVSAVIHTHSPMATSFAVLNKPIPAVIYEVASFGLDDGMVPVAPYSRPGTTQLAYNVAEAMKNSNLVLMEKHGVCVAGTDLDDALLKAQYTEELAEIYFNALLINKGVEPDAFDGEELSKWSYPAEFKYKK